MGQFANRADIAAIEAEMAWADRPLPKTMYDFISSAKDRFGARNAVSFQLLSDPTSKSETLTWAAYHAQITQAANLFRSLGIGPTDVVAYVLPNALETAVTLVAGAVAGIVNPINPLLEPEKMASILRETKAKVVVTLKPFPKTDLAQKVAQAVALAPGVTTVLEVDLVRYLSGLKKVIVPLIRPKNPVTHKAVVTSFAAECARQPSDRLTFADPKDDRVAAYFHTGGTTGMPKVAQHKVSGMIYNGWLGQRLLFTERDVFLCPLPLFHVLAAYPVMMSTIASGAHIVLPTPQGYRGEGVFDNFWKLIARYRCSYMITVPTALSALMQRPIDADVSCLKSAISGSSPLPVELYNRFKKETGIEIIEGYGLTEATCLVSINPPEGTKKIGSVGLAFPYTHVRILTKKGDIFHECAVDEVGEICVAAPGVFEGSTYTEVDKNRDLFAEGRFLRTGDLGRMDADGYLFITGRAKDLIIRGGHNIDPALIEEALMGHPSVAVVGAIGQPDAHAGELPAAYVELVMGSTTTVEELMEFASKHILERAAMPKHIELMAEVPKTAVGKVFKPDLRRMAMTRVFNAALAEAGQAAHVASVIEDKKRGLVAQIKKTGAVDEARVAEVMGGFANAWEWAA